MTPGAAKRGRADNRGAPMKNLLKLVPVVLAGCVCAPCALHAADATVAETVIAETQQASPFMAQVPAGIMEKAAAAMQKIRKGTPVDKAQAVKIRDTLGVVMETPILKLRIRMDIVAQFRAIGTPVLPFMDDILRTSRPGRVNVLWILWQMELQYYVLPEEQNKRPRLVAFTDASIPLLERCLYDRDADIREAAVTVLGNLATWNDLVGKGVRDAEIVPQLTRMLKDESESVRLWAARELGALGMSKEIPPDLLMKMQQKP
jgi:hypothetical protein